jgi:hypothetical protein
MLKTVGNPSTRTGDQTIVNGNLVIGTAGKGIDFSADPSAAGMTSELLNDYEEGTWTATFTGTTTAPTVPITTTARYTKVGRLVTININFPIPFDTTGASGNVRVDGLPFTPLVAAFGAVSLAELGNDPAVAITSGTSITFAKATDVYTPIPMNTTLYASLRLTLTYTV